MEANYFTILYWFCHTSTWIRHGCTHVPHPEPPTHLPPCTIPLGHPSAPTSSILYPASNLDWQFVSYMILYMFQCHSPKFSSSSLSAIKSLSPPCKQLLLLFLFSEKTDSWEGWLPDSQPHSCWMLGLEFEHNFVCSQGLSFSVLCCIWGKVGTKEDSGLRKAQDWFLGVPRTFPQAGDHLC